LFFILRNVQREKRALPLSLWTFTTIAATDS
jgi:hypothetical protein